VRFNQEILREFGNADIGVLSVAGNVENVDVVVLAPLNELGELFFAIMLGVIDVETGTAVLGAEVGGQLAARTPP